METTRDMPHKKMFYILVAITVIAILSGIYISQEKTTAPKPAPQRQSAAVGSLASPDPFHEFGKISMAAGKVSHKFTIENTGQDPVTITKLYTSCMCTTATLLTLAGKKGPYGMIGHSPIPTIAETLAPGGRARVEIVFDPAAHGPAGVGRIERVITAETKSGKPLELGFVAMVRP
jgi:hypothetical protein